MKFNIEGAWAALKTGDYEGAIAALFSGFKSVQEFVDDVINYLRNAIGVKDFE